MSHLAVEAYEASLGAGPPASVRLQLQAPVTIRVPHLMKVSRAPAPPAVTKGRVELPSPCGHDVLSVACLPVAPLGHVRLETVDRRLKEEVRDRFPQVSSLKPPVLKECVGTELNRQCPKAGGLQPLGHANAQPTQGVSSSTGGSRTHKITEV